MSESYLRVYKLPAEVGEMELAGTATVVIDLLRATTTIATALASGAREVVPFREIDETLAAATRLGRSNVVLGGERGGRPIAGFDLGNSPAEYTPEAIGGRPVYITTTNGTRALYHARRARRVIVGAIVNLSAVVASLREERSINILCAGTDGRETQEDLLAAGAMVHGLREQPGRGNHALNGEATLAERDWCDLVHKAKLGGRTLAGELAEALLVTPGGRNLAEVGLGSDLPLCAAIDRLGIAPELDVTNWRITVPRPESLSR